MVILSTFVTGSAKIDHLSTKNHQFLLFLCDHNVITIYTTTTNTSSVLQNLMGFPSAAYENGILHSEQETLVKI